MKQHVRIFTLFISHYMKHMRRKWKSLPLLLLFPFLIIGFLLAGIVTFFIPPEDEPVKVGLVDNDQSEETEIVIRAFIEGTELGSFIEIIPVRENEAKALLEEEKLSAYVMFPEGFTSDLYRGHSIEIPVIGNEKRALESQLIYEFVQSITRLIETAQANILTIYAYAQDLPMEEQERTDILFDEFKEFFFYTVNKDETLRENELQNKATLSPIKYFSLAAIFFTSIIWSFLFYVMLYKETSIDLLQRMRLYGVRAYQLIHSRIFVAFVLSLGSTVGLFYSLKPFLFKEIDTTATMQTIGLFALCIGIYIIGLAIIDQLFSSIQFSFTFQLMYTILCVLFSGALIPRMYFPIQLQSVLDALFTTYTFDALLHVTVFDGMFVSFNPLWIMTGSLAVIYIGISFWKGRFER